MDIDERSVVVIKKIGILGMALMLVISSLPLNIIAEAIEPDGESIWYGKFFDNHTFEGSPTEEEFDSIDFSWEKDNPLSDNGSSLFSAIFTSTVTSDYNATVQLQGVVSGELVLYLNGEKVYEIDEDTASSFNEEVKLQQGTNEFKIEYKNNPEDAKLKLDILQSDSSDNAEALDEELPTDKWLANYYETLDLTGEKQEELVANLQFNDLDSFSNNISLKESFSSSYDRAYIVTEESNYVISGTVQGGIKVYVDEELLIEEWASGLNEINSKFTLNEGTHHVRVEYKNDHEKIPFIKLDVLEEATDESEEPGADSEESSDEAEEPGVDSEESSDETEESRETVNQSTFFSAARTSINHWTAEFYANTSFSGKPIVNTYEKLNLNWGTGSPHPSIPNDKFSAVFKKQLNVGETSFYRISGRADDGIRVYVDNKLVINHWKDGVNNYRKDLLLTKGTHDIKVEYYDNKYSAAISVDVTPIKEIVDENWEAAYYPNGNFTGNPVVKKMNKLDLNWGSGSPDSKIPNDNFTATFHKKLKVTKVTDFLFEGRADDGIRVYVNDKLVINQWKEGVNRYSNKVRLSPGEHLIRVEYFDKKYSAAISLDIIDLTASSDAWTATYYPTKNFQGASVKRVVQKLDLNWGTGSPAVGIPSDNFSAIFEKKLVVQKSGTYHITGRADDGIRVFVDGKLVINSWKNGVNTLNHLVELSKGTHNIKVEYYDEKYSAAIKLDIKEASVPKDAWLATYYPTKSFTGLPVKRYEQKLDLNWGAGSPDSSIPKDNFTATFEREIQVTKAGTYQFSGRADDGIRIFVNGRKELDLWKKGVNSFSENVDLPVGKHKIKVEYYDEKYSAAIKLDIKQATKQTIYKKTKYSSTFNAALNKQMQTKPQTDKKYPAYISKPAIVVSNNSASGTVKGGPWNVRGLPGTESPSWVLGQLTNGAKVGLLGEVSDSKGGRWYRINYIKSWVNASSTDVSYYMNPANFAVNSKEYYQFLSLKGSGSISIKEVNDKILAGKGILQGKASSFSEASKVHGINEIYLISHALLETGNGSSTLAKGVRVTSVDGKPVTPKVVYNTYGIGANDNCAIKCGSEYAYKKNWTSPEAAIVGGASFISNNYIHAGQDTLYKMRWNPAAPATHQYATDIGWAVKQTNRMYEFYSLLDTYTLTFDVPEYR